MTFIYDLLDKYFRSTNENDVDIYLLRLLSTSSTGVKHVWTSKHTRRRKTQAAVRVYVNKGCRIFLREHKRRGFRQTERYERRRKWWFGITGKPRDPVRETPDCRLVGDVNMLKHVRRHRDMRGFTP